MLAHKVVSFLLDSYEIIKLIKSTKKGWKILEDYEVRSGL